MVITDLNVVSVAIDKPKADSPLIVDRNRMLPFPVAAKGVESVARRYFQIVKPNRQVQVLELSSRPLGDVAWNTPRLASGVELQSPSIRERLDHEAECNASRDSRQLESAV
jgi:hypothetical protein